MPHEVKTTCPYCGVGCGVIARVEDDGAVSVKGDPDHPANFGRLCSKGSALAETLDLDGRILHPEVNGRQAGWDEALDLVACRFSDAIAMHGPDSVAFYVSGQLLTEDYYVANKLMKGFIGSANIDTNSRLCMSSSVAGHRRAFGSDTVPCTYDDLELADLVVLVGSNMAWCHPVLYQRLVAAKTARPDMKVVVIDPRRTMTSEIADLHLAIRPDGDVALFMGLLAHLTGADMVDQAYVAAHTIGFAEAFVAASSLSRGTLCSLTGLTDAEITAFYSLFARNRKVVTCYSQGVNQSSVGTDKVNAIINCHLATGRIGRPGMGPFSLTGQPNAMGGREVGGLANMLAAHMSIENEADRDRVQRFWASPTIAAKPGLKAVDMFRAVADGRIKALWIMATNPVVSMPDADSVKAAIAACPFVVVSDIQRNTDTAALAHVLLPSLGWGEKDGTVTNSERRISRQRRFLGGASQARPDWWQMAEVGRRMGFGPAFAYPSSAAIFAEHAALSAFENNGSRDFDIGGLASLDEEQYQSLAPVQWPCTADGHRKETRFFGDGKFYHADGKARFVAVSPAAADQTTNHLRFTLNTGRIRDHWHTMTRTGKSARLSAHIAEPFAEIHPRDADTLGIVDADLVRIENELGTVIVRALLTDRQARGNIFVPMHWNDQFASAARVDTLVRSITDPHSGQPASKNVPASLSPFNGRAFAFAICRARPSDIDAAYWALAKAEGGWRLELGFDQPVDDWAGWCRKTFALPASTEHLVYLDKTSGVQRLAFFNGSELLVAIFIASEPVSVARSWAVGQLGADMSAPRNRMALVAGRPGADDVDRGAMVCACMGVGINQIADAAIAGCKTVAAIGQATRAGTNCGACRSEIKVILERINRSDNHPAEEPLVAAQ